MLEIFPATNDDGDKNLMDVLGNIKELKNYLNHIVSQNQLKEVVEHILKALDLKRPTLSVLSFILLGLEELKENKLLDEFKRAIRHVSSVSCLVHSVIKQLMKMINRACVN